MTTRRTTPPLLYAQSAPRGWFSSLTAAVDDAAAALCRMYWRQGRSLALRPVRVTAPSCRMQ